VILKSFVKLRSKKSLHSLQQTTKSAIKSNEDLNHVTEPDIANSPNKDLSFFFPACLKEPTVEVNGKTSKARQVLNSSILRLRDREPDETIVQAVKNRLSMISL